MGEGRERVKYWIGGRRKSEKKNTGHELMRRGQTVILDEWGRRNGGEGKECQPAHGFTKDDRGFFAVQKRRTDCQLNQDANTKGGHTGGGAVIVFLKKTA